MSNNEKCSIHSYSVDNTIFFEIRGSTECKQLVFNCIKDKCYTLFNTYSLIIRDNDCLDYIGDCVIDANLNNTFWLYVMLIIALIAFILAICALICLYRQDTKITPQKPISLPKESV